jgi:hypothetical protein
MAITTYAELQTTIANFLDRSDLTSIIPTFIDLCEADMSRKIRHWRMEQRSTAELDTQYSALPADFLEPIRLSITGGSTYTLEMESQAQMSNRRMQNLDTGGRPRYYAMTDGKIEVYPSPDATYELEMVYHAKIPALADDATSNWVLSYHPDAYLYGALIHSAPYLVEDARTQIWSALYQSAVDGINIDNEKAKFGGSGHRMKIRSY